MKKIAFLTTALFLHAWTFAAPVALTMPPPLYFWPSSERSPSKIKEDWVIFDRIKVAVNRLYLAGSEFEIPYLGGFDFLKNEHTRWNATFVIAANPQVRWGVAVFRPGDFLPTLNEEALKGYIRGLERKGATKIETTLNGLDFDAAILGERPHEIRYLLPSGIKRSEFFLMYKGKLWVFAYEAPENIYEANRENVFVIWARLRSKS